MEGLRLAQFELLEKLGEGGMGVVYKARDTRLDRFVAIKLLPESELKDSERRARFMQEARSASALNHPGIVTIHEISEENGRYFIVMEFIDGKSLSQRIPRKGMPLTEGLRIAVQIADALAAAHAAGLVHRDIKPANIMVDAQGRAKVLDFGLAKLAAAKSGSGDSAETRTVAMGEPLTQEGAIVGSIPYMSPEQVEGRPLDARSDIFSFGAVLYEMFTGQRAFQGKTRISTLASVVERDPAPVSEVAPAVPAELERVIARCLRKDLARRSQHMTDVKLALEELRDESESGKLARPAMSQASAPHSRWGWPVMAAACVALIAAAFTGWPFLRTTAPPPAANMVRVSPDDGQIDDLPAISADGKFVAFISQRDGTDQVWVRHMGGGPAAQLTHSPNRPRRVQFFPDGSRLLIDTVSPGDDRNTIEIVPLLGGQSRVMWTGRIESASLSPDGRQIAWAEFVPPFPIQIKVMPVEGGTPRVLENYRLTQGAGQWYSKVDWMPDSRSICVTGDPSNAGWDWFALPLDGGDPAPMGGGAALRAAGLKEPSFVLVAPDRLLFSSGRGSDRSNIWQIPLNAESKRIAGSPRQLTFGAEEETPTGVNAAGTLAFSSAKVSTDLYALPLDSATGQASGPVRRLTRDGREKDMGYVEDGEPGVMYFRVPERGSARPQWTIFGLDLSTSQQSVVAPLVDFAAGFAVSPDGRSIAYGVADAGAYSIRLAEPGALPQAGRSLCSKCGRVNLFSPDGRYLLITPEDTVPAFGTHASLALLEVATGKVTPWLQDPRETIRPGSFLSGEYLTILAGPASSAPSNQMKEYLAPWRLTPPPRSEWVDVPARQEPSPAAPVAYSFERGQLMARRFDEMQKRMGEPVPVRIPPGSAIQPRESDQMNVRGSAIGFLRFEVTSSSVWLVKLPPD